MNAQQSEYKNCKHCGAVIRPGKNRRREYCNAKCKQAAYNARLRGQNETAVTPTIETVTAANVTA